MNVPPSLLPFDNGEKIARRAKELLAKLDPAGADDRAKWLAIGQILQSIDPDNKFGLLDAWEDWSRQSSKYKDGEVARLWAGFKTDGGLTIATLVKLAREDESAGLSADQPIDLTAPFTDESEVPPFNAELLERLNKRIRLNRKSPGRASPPSKPKPQNSLDSVATRMAERLGLCETYRGVFQNREGHDVLAEVRYERPGGGEKTIRQFRRNESGGWEAGSLQANCPLFGLPKLLNADASQAVYICEGPRKADKLREYGFLATASIQGAQSAGRTEWPPLAGRMAVILRDNDAAGQHYAIKVAEILSQLNPPAMVKNVLLPELTDGGDFIDFAENRSGAGRSIEDIRAEIQALVNATEFFDPQAKRGRLTVAEWKDNYPQTDWVWLGYLARDAFTLLAGNGGVGKTFLLAILIMFITTGNPWPGENDRRPPLDVILITGEDTESTLAQRLRAAGADMKRVHLVTGIEYADPKTGKPASRLFNLQSDLPALDDFLAQYPSTAVIMLDPITAMLGDCKLNDAIEVRGVIGPFFRLLERHGIAGLATTHLNKDEKASAVHRILGSGAFLQASRIVCTLTSNKDDRDSVFFAMLKNNLAKFPPTWQLRRVPSDNLEVPRLEFDKIVERDAESLLTESESGNKDKSKIEQVSEALEVLLEKGDWIEKAHLIMEVRRQIPFIVSEKTVERAAKAIGIERDLRGKPPKAYWRRSSEKQS